MAGPVLVPLLAVPGPVRIVVVVASVAVAALLLFVIAGFAYRVMTDLERPKDVLFEDDGDDDDGVRRGGEDEPWDYY